MWKTAFWQGRARVLSPQGNVEKFFVFHRDFPSLQKTDLSTESFSHSTTLVELESRIFEGRWHHQFCLHTGRRGRRPLHGSHLVGRDDSARRYSAFCIFFPQRKEASAKADASLVK
jgi:hypothetical protein